MKILLIHPPFTGKERYGKLASAGAYWPPLGLCYIAAVLEKNNHKVQIIDGLNENITTKQIINKISKTNPDLIGITSVTTIHYRTIEMANEIKKRYPNLKIIIGGPHVTLSLKKTLKDKCFDIGVYGEGEYTMPELVKAIEKNKPLNKIKGIIYREKGKIIQTKSRPFIKNLDELPLPARHLLNMDIYRTHILAHRRKKAASIITSRGCPFQCVFCNRIFGRKYRTHSPEYVVAEIDQLVKKYGIQELEIKDDNFVADPERVKKICKLLIKRNYDLIWSCDVRADAAEKEMFKLMKKAGCWLIQMGIETGDENVMKAIKKGITIEQVKRAVNLANNEGLEVKGFFMIGHHVDTKETIEKTIKFAKSLPLHTANFAIAVPFEGSELYNIKEKYGTFDGNVKELSAHTDSPPFVPFGLTKEYLRKMKKKAYLSFYGNPKLILRLIKNIRSFYDVKRYLTGALVYLRLQFS